MLDRRIEALMFAGRSAEGADERQIADHVDHLAVDPCGFLGEVMMQGPTGGREAEHRDNHDDRGDDHHSPPLTG